MKVVVGCVFNMLATLKADRMWPLQQTNTHPSVCLQAFFLVYSLGCLCVYLDQVTVLQQIATRGQTSWSGLPFPLMGRQLWVGVGLWVSLLSRQKATMTNCVIGQEPLSILQLWRKFRSLRPDFISLFATYQHFRSKGWIPKGGSGAKYGVDFRKITQTCLYI